MPTLRNIAAYVTHFTEAIATIAGVDIEVIDARSIRVAGTGIYSVSVGESIKSFGRIYNYALTHHETVFIENPKSHQLCRNCANSGSCEEKLTFCTPIIASGQIIGVIGLVCFNNADRARIIQNRDMYVYFFRQIADGIARVAENEQSTQKLRQSMDMLLKVTNSNAACVLVLDAENRISFSNDGARAELGIGEGGDFQSMEVVDANNRTQDTGEFTIRLLRLDGGEERKLVLGRLLDLSLEDRIYRKALVFDSRQRVAEILSGSRTVKDTPETLRSIVGTSRAITAVKEQILKIARTSSTVLITGESGTGKEMVARAIHATSNRNKAPFIALNCGAIPDTLLESELFGYVGGAFTGASAQGRMGKFELADKGILFLDEISSMPLYLQVKLLRVLQERSFSRLGSNNTVSLDIRVIAAANERIPDLIAQRMFREDLYYRLNVIPIDIPPLRERLDDIPLLAEHFLRRYCELFAKPMCGLSPELAGSLADYPWPGNIREFENCMEYMVNMVNAHDGGILTISHLPAKLRSAEKARQPPTSARSPQSAQSATSAAALSFTQPDGAITPISRLEQQAIRHALAVFGTTSDAKRRAAEALGISAATLYRKLKEENRKTEMTGIS